MIWVIVHNAKEWDDGKGDAVAHGRRMQSNWKENVVTIIIKALFNIVLLLPLCYLGDFKIFRINLRPLVRLSEILLQFTKCKKDKTS